MTKADLERLNAAGARKDPIPSEPPSRVGVDTCKRGANKRPAREDYTEALLAAVIKLQSGV